MMWGELHKEFRLFLSIRAVEEIECEINFNYLAGYSQFHCDALSSNRISTFLAINPSTCSNENISMGLEKQSKISLIHHLVFFQLRYERQIISSGKKSRLISIFRVCDNSILSAKREKINKKSIIIDSAFFFFSHLPCMYVCL